MKMNHIKRNAGQWIAAMAAMALALAGGCQSQSHDSDNKVHGELFRPTDEERPVHRFAEVQAAAAARTDGTLRAYHFGCGDLNSLGQDKLDLMLKDEEACDHLVIYLDLPMDDTLASREDAVRVYLKDRGLTDAQVKFQHGPNLAQSTPVETALRALRAIDSGAPVGVNPEPTGSPLPGQPSH